MLWLAVGEFLLDNGSGFCTQINHAENESKRWNVLIADQIYGNQDKNGYDHTENSADCVLESDVKNLIKYGLQTAICVTHRLAPVFYALHTS